MITRPITLEFLGTGTSTGIPEVGCSCHTCTSTAAEDKRMRSSALVTVGGKRLLIDCGPDFRTQALRAGINHIDALLLTHEHYDHVGGIDDLRTLCRGKKIPIYLESKVGEALRCRMPYCFSENPYPGAPLLDLIPITQEPFEAAGIPIVPLRIHHGALSILGFRIGDLAYITDMHHISDEEVLKLSGIKVLVVNALRHVEHISHQSLSMALSFIQRVAPQESYLIHANHQLGRYHEVTPSLPPKVHLAYDTLNLVIP